MPPVDDQPDTALARVLLEQGALDVGTLRGCLDDVRRQRDRDPQVTLARLLVDRRLLPAEAIHAAARAAAAVPLTELDLGLTLLRVHDPVRAAAAAAKALELDPSATQAWYVRGAARLELGDRGGADDLQEFLRRDPEPSLAAIARARLAALPGPERRR